MKEIADSVMKFEMAKRFMPGDIPEQCDGLPKGVPAQPELTGLAAELAKLDPVDRNLIVRAGELVLDLVVEEALSFQRQANGFGSPVERQGNGGI